MHQEDKTNEWKTKQDKSRQDKARQDKKKTRHVNLSKQIFCMFEGTREISAKKVILHDEGGAGFSKTDFA